MNSSILFFGEGITARLARDVDWSHHPLGGVETWPVELKTSLALIFNSRQPMFLYWGPEYFFFLNDAAVSLIEAQKLKSAMGCPGAKVWHQAWHDLKLPRLRAVVEGRIGTRHQDEQVNEGRFDGSLSPIWLNNGDVGGVLQIHNDTSMAISLQVLADSVPVMLIVCSPDGRLEFANRTYLEFCDKTLRHVQDGEWVDLFDPLEFDSLMQEFSLKMQAGHGFSHEVRLRRKDGQYRWHLMRLHPHLDGSGVLVKWYGSYTDIHEQKTTGEKLTQAKNEAERANEAKSTFLANMSHELRTPMTAVLGFAELLNETNLSDDARQDAVHRIERSGRALLRLIDNVLDLSKVEIGKVQVLMEPFSPEGLVMDVVGLLKPMAEQKSLELRLSVDADMPRFLSSDPGRLRQILLNLIGNAIKFTWQGFINLDLRYQDDRFLLVDVRDTGIGVPRHEQHQLFKPFAQANETITRKFGGTGLGLALSRRLCESLNGSLVLIESEPGVGSCFRACIEARVHAAAPVYIPNSVKDLMLPSLKNVRVLIADDAPENQILFKHYLELAGIKVSVVANGLEAYRRAQEEDFDLVLMDIQMPKMDGLQATRKLRQNGYTRPILALTAHAMKEEVTRSIEAGCNAHLNKPITRASLLQALQNHLSASSSR